MAKSLLLLLCCAFFFRALQAQDRPDTTIPQRLELKKSDIGWASHTNYFVKKTDADDVHSILYQPAKRDTFQLDLPQLKNHSIDFHARVGRREPLFREQ